jgi:hypothetical protein
MNPTLLVMAAGMGSRFGGLKQVAAVGPHEATLLDYSLYNASKAGFAQVVFVIRHDMEDDFKEAVGIKWEKRLKVRYMYQELGILPVDFPTPKDRQKPWGTAHAVWVAQAAVSTPFAVINADDYYGPKAFATLGKFLSKVDPKSLSFAMVGYALKNTLSPHGSVSRGVCQKTPGGFLRTVEEHTDIALKGKALSGVDAQGKKKRLTGKETVSMNMWGFTPRVFGEIEKALVAFLKERGAELKAECYLPAVVDALIKDGKAKARVLPTSDPWYGLTYPEDKAFVYEQIHKLVFKKVYPERLW